MTRPSKQIVDYFPHDCEHGKTMFILEERFKNDGYAFWFKLLELLGSTEGHCLDLNDQANVEFLTSKTHLTEGFCFGILDLLSKLGAIDTDLWLQRRVWSQNFVDGVSAVYQRRGGKFPQKPTVTPGSRIRNHPSPHVPESETLTTRARVEESRVNNKIPDLSPAEPPAEEKSPIIAPPSAPSVVFEGSRPNQIQHFVITDSDGGQNTISLSFWRKLVNLCNDDQNEAGLILYRAHKKAKKNGLIAWVMRGMSEKDQYARKPILEEEKNKREANDWKEKNIFSILYSRGGGG